jgi:hypothetical protein
MIKIISYKKDGFIGKITTHQQLNQAIHAKEANMAANIFISHRHTDSAAATEMKNILERLSENGRLQIFISEHIEGGQNWFRWIQERLAESNLLILLYTDSSELAKLLKRKKVEKHYEGLHLFIDVYNEDQIEEKKIPPDASVISDQQGIWELFDLQAGRWTWKDIENEAKKSKDTVWLTELSNAMYRSRFKRRIIPIRSSYFSRTVMKSFRPILYRVDRRSDNSVQFKLLFIEDFSWQFVNIPEKIGTLVTALTMNTRLRHEILIPFMHRLRTDSSDNARRKLCDEVLQKMYIIEEDAMARGLLNEEKLSNVFENLKEKDGILEMYKKWYNLKGSVTECVENNRCDEVLDLLSELKELNDTFLDIGTHRLHDISNETNEKPALTTDGQAQRPASIATKRRHWPQTGETAAA